MHRGEEKSAGEEKSGGEAKGERAVWTSPAARRAKAELEQWNGVVEAAMNWAQDVSLEATFEEFAREHAHVFADAAESKEEEPEHKLEYTECHERFLKMFEGLLEEFLAGQQMSVGDFFARCKTAMSEDDVSALADNRWFVQMLLGMLEYSSFYENMVEAARAATRK